jgi:hypothetical protein
MSEFPLESLGSGWGVTSSRQTPLLVEYRSPRFKAVESLKQKCQWVERGFETKNDYYAMMLPADGLHSVKVCNGV